MKNTLKILAMLLFIITGCKKLVEVESPTTSVSSINIYNNDATAIGVLTSIYVKLVGSAVPSLQEQGPLSSLSCIASLSADELEYFKLSRNVALDGFYQNALTDLNVGISSFWGESYAQLYVINSAIEGLTASATLNPLVKKQLLGEARFMRAFYYFYLINLYGEVPLVLSSDYTTNASIVKSTKEANYQQIIADLNEAEKLLSDEYLQGDCKRAYPTGAVERLRPTKWAAKFLLARTYLYMKQWANSETEATAVLNNKEHFQLESLNQVFLKNNRESILQLQPTASGFNSADANTFILPIQGPNSEYPFYLNEELINAFNRDDQRKTNWIGSVSNAGINYHYSNKYKIPRATPGALVSEYTVVMRLAEQYLIRAEARAQQGNLEGAISDIDMIRNRAGLKPIKSLDPNVNKEGLLNLIEKERRLEFFTEWGDRWLNLKRIGKIDEVMSIVTPKKSNGAVWHSYQQYYPIPFNELQANRNLTPTPGY